jgi:hypothetical protein
LAFPDAEKYAPADFSVDQNTKHFPSHQMGMVGVVKQILDHVMSPLAAESASKYAAEKMWILPNIAILQKAAR